MFGAKVRGTGVGCSSTPLGNGDESIRRVTREKFVIRGNTAFRTLDSTTSFLPIVEK